MVKFKMVNFKGSNGQLQRFKVQMVKFKGLKLPFPIFGPTKSHKPTYTHKPTFTVKDPEDTATGGPSQDRQEQNVHTKKKGNKTRIDPLPNRSKLLLNTSQMTLYHLYTYHLLILKAVHIVINGKGSSLYLWWSTWAQPCLLPLFNRTIHIFFSLKVFCFCCCYSWR